MPSLAGPSGKTMTGTTPHRPDGQRPNTYVGAAIERNEDLRFLRGRGCYLDDLVRPGQWHAAFVRSPLAHGRIVRIDTTAAMAMRGVRAVITGADIGPIIPKIPFRRPNPHPDPLPIVKDDGERGMRVCLRAVPTMRVHSHGAPANAKLRRRAEKIFARLRWAPKTSSCPHVPPGPRGKEIMG